MDTGVAVFHDLAILGNASGQFREIDAMPVGGGEEADGDGQGGPNLRTVERQAGWQVIGYLGYNAEIEEQCEGKNCQLNATRNAIGQYFSFRPFTKNQGQRHIQRTEKSGAPQRHRNNIYELREDQSQARIDKSSWNGSGHESSQSGTSTHNNSRACRYYSIF